MKLLCKKSLLSSISGKISQILSKGKYYTIEKINADYMEIKYPFYVVDDKGDDWTFSDRPELSLYIWNYFYTPQEERKIKLEKINEITL